MQRTKSLYNVEVLVTKFWLPYVHKGILMVRVKLKFKLARLDPLPCQVELTRVKY